MKPIAKSEISLAEKVIAEAREHAENCATAMRKSCAHALLAGMRLVWLHKETSAQGARNDFVPRGTKFGFEEAVTAVGIPKRTAYRWMNAFERACYAANLLKEGEGILGEIPEAGTIRWEKWEATLVEMTAGMSLNRLLLGSDGGKTDVARHNDLVWAEEAGRERAIELMAAVESGKYTLAQAVKALGSQEAYDKLKADGGEKVRKDPVYLDYDPLEKKAVGLVPKAFVTLGNAFPHWDDYEEEARKDVHAMWLSLVKSAPKELTMLLKI